jgi:hypothetical protein
LDVEDQGEEEKHAADPSDFAFAVVVKLVHAEICLHCSERVHEA